MVNDEAASKRRTDACMKSLPLDDRQAAPGVVAGANGPDGLTACALAYLAIPNVIFLCGWFRLPFALLLSAAMLYLVAQVFSARRIEWRSGYSRSALLVIFATACAWSAFAGGSHFMYANPDWVVRDAVLGDLVRFDWPVRYFAAAGSPLILRSAIGFFLPVALFGKAFGVAQLDLAVYLWTTAGVLIFLLLLPLPSATGWRLTLALTLVVFFSGMDFIAALIVGESMPIFPLRLEWWGPWSYSSLTGQLLWAPNHCLPIWIVTLLCFRHRNGDEFVSVAAAALPLTLIWTPFAVIGIAPFVVLAAVNWIRHHGWHKVPWKVIIAAASLSLPIVLLLLTDVGQMDLTITTAAANNPASIRAWQAASRQDYFLFVGCEFLFLALVIAPHVCTARAEFWLAVIVLLALPLLRFGPSNDLGLRVSTPSLVILMVICLQTLLAKNRPVFAGTLWIATLFLVVGAHTAVNELWRAATFRRSAPGYQHTLANRQGGQPATHYVGRVDSSPIRHALKPVPAAETRLE